MNDINKVFLIGRITKDPDLRYTQGGTAVVSFSIANNKSYTANNEKKDEVSFFNCVAWAKLAENISKYTGKGDKIALEGRLQQRTWTDKEGIKKSVVEIQAENVQFLNTKKSPDNSQDGTREASTAEKFGNQEPAFSDADIPF